MLRSNSWFGYATTRSHTHTCARTHHHGSVLTPSCLPVYLTNRHDCNQQFTTQFLKKTHKIPRLMQVQFPEVINKKLHYLRSAHAVFNYYRHSMVEVKYVSFDVTLWGLRHLTLNTFALSNATLVSSSTEKKFCLICTLLVDATLASSSTKTLTKSLVSFDAAWNFSWRTHETYTLVVTVI